ncbi:monooxygenase [Talaromyces proteolyticus]|uniref:Monooxygenase n=1 Tax=Talaromyces proteolyticus TaxID=1131652 RepID=A0AAD4KJN3_9EURO|nr:monooxygenase [Talaromyces proteolyticus]KAH8689854.1 monooxygenase [Talaromyces proteolyticus]
MNLTNSSIWNGSTGFVTVGDGRCVTDGPFSGLRPVLYNHTYSQHCLLRGFRDGSKAGRLPSTPFSPESVGGLLREPTCEKFVRQIEFSVHNIMHLSIAGDFLALTAANDPIFFVHHAQLDRLWWQWQQENLGKRVQEYHGEHMFNSTRKVSLSDMTMVGGLAEDIPVSKVMNTKDGFLCYRY